MNPLVEIDGYAEKLVYISFYLGLKTQKEITSKVGIKRAWVFKCISKLLKQNLLICVEKKLGIYEVNRAGLDPFVESSPLDSTIHSAGLDPSVESSGLDSTVHSAGLDLSVESSPLDSAVHSAGLDPLNLNKFKNLNKEINKGTGKKDYDLMRGQFSKIISIVRDGNYNVSETCLEIYEIWKEIDSTRCSNVLTWQIWTLIHCNSIPFTKPYFYRLLKEAKQEENNAGSGKTLYYLANKIDSEWNNNEKIIKMGLVNIVRSHPATEFRQLVNIVTQFDFKIPEYNFFPSEKRKNLWRIMSI